MIRYRLLVVVLLLIACLAALGVWRLDIDTDVVRSLPSGDKVIADGLEIFTHHPVHDQIAVDVMLEDDDPDLLVEIGAFLEERLHESGLFAQVGTDSIGELLPELALHAAQNLPILFSEKELEQQVLPLLGAEQIQQRILQLYQELGSMEGIGQTGFIDLDPLGLKDLVLAKMAPLAPSLNANFYRGSLLSADGHHLLVTATPLAAGTDTASARRIAELLADIAQQLTSKYSSRGQEVTLTPVGAYRAALDNESIIRHDVQLALVLATAGIALLLLFAFPRPLIGLLSLVPALAGTGTAIFVYSLFHSSISIMVLGFGGAIISITVDHGIAYLLFLDRNHTTRGKEASHEVRAIGIMAVITSIGAFLILTFSGFPVFAELGQFTALGIFFSFVFVHSVFPRIFPTMPPGSKRPLVLHNLVNILYNSGKPGAIAALLLFSGLLFFARPHFHVSLSSMNTVSDATLAADELFSRVWGNVGERVLLMNSAGHIDEIQRHNDLLLGRMEQDIQEDVLTAAFVPSMLFPGRERATQNLAAWHTFWNGYRGKQVEETLRAAGTELGFTSDAFTDFLKLLDPGLTAHHQPIPARYFSLLGISENKKDSSLIQFITVLPGEHYDGADFESRYGQDGRIFDANFFTSRLADILFETFTTMLAIIVISVVVLLLFFYLNLPLTLLTLLPSFFAYICTLGTLTIIGHPLDIPTLMLSVVIFGMGIDYSIFCVRAHQRYGDINHPSYVLVRVAVFMAGASTLVGFGVLAAAEHSLLKSIGITSLLGIGYSLLGTFLLLPPLLKLYFNRRSRTVSVSAINDINTRIRHHFSALEPYPRMFARFKLQFDPMFRDLPRILDQQEKIETIIDIGCGYGVPACWCLEHYPQAKVYGIDPDPERVRVAALALGDRGAVTVGQAPAIPAAPQPADVVLLLDMLHYLDDETASVLFRQSFQALRENGILVTRFVLPPADHPSWSWRLEDIRIKISGRQPWYRSIEQVAECMQDTGFEIMESEVSAVNPELVWMVCRAGRVTVGRDKKS